MALFASAHTLGYKSAAWPAATALNHSCFIPARLKEAGKEKQRGGRRRLLTAFALLAAFVTGDTVHVLSIGDVTWWKTGAYLTASHTQRSTAPIQPPTGPQTFSSSEQTSRMCSGAAII